ncbi:DUF397 domain-containing protein [Actinomycetes bacterium KLBMP 9759]
MIEFKISSFCNLGNCVEVGRLPDGSFAVRDTKDRSTTLTFSVDEWAAFVAGVKNGEFDATQPVGA